MPCRLGIVELSENGVYEFKYMSEAIYFCFKCKKKSILRFNKVLHS